MEVILERAIEFDAESIFNIQVQAFKPLLEKYKDYKTNPANETIDKVITKINHPNGRFYKILVNRTLVGAIFVFWKEKTTQFWISPILILHSYQGKGIAQKALILIEGMFLQATSWELATILEEERNCYLYEKMGYIQAGLKKKLNDHTTLVYYKKIL